MILIVIGLSVQCQLALKTVAVGFRITLFLNGIASRKLAGSLCQTILVNIVDFLIDHMYFGQARFFGVAQQQGIADEDIRELRMAYDDLYSNEECALRAAALVDYYKEAQQSFSIQSSVFDYGLTPILAGSSVHFALHSWNNEIFAAINILIDTITGVLVGHKA